MVKPKVYERYKKAAARLKNTEREMFKVRDLLEYIDFDGYDIDVDGTNAVYARCSEILDEHYAALEEYQICDHNANYALQMDVGILLSERELMLKIMRCVSNTEAWDREAIATMARTFLKNSGVE